MIIGIHQPNFFPWIGYFHKINKSEKFVFLDNVQFSKTGGSYVNRTEIMMGGRRNWLTLPVKRFHGTWNINQCIFSEPQWRKRIINSLRINYSKAPYFKSTQDFIVSLIEFNTENLSDFNINAIKNIAAFLNIKREFCRSAELNITEEDPTLRLISIIRSLNGDTYMSGKGGLKYQDDLLFEKNQIKVVFNDFQHPRYNHPVTNSLETGLSILDLIFSLGSENLIKIIQNA